MSVASSQRRQGFPSHFFPDRQTRKDFAERDFRKSSSLYCRVRSLPGARSARPIMKDDPRFFEAKDWNDAPVLGFQSIQRPCTIP